MDVLSARSANLLLAKADICALALTLAVAPVKINVGGYLALVFEAVRSRRGRAACEKMRAPLLFVHVNVC
jgi:hypothetical protein